MTAARIVGGLVLAAIVGGAIAYFGIMGMRTAALDELAERTRAGLIYVEGGAFTAGNYEIDVRKPDGTVERRWVYDPGFAPEPYPVTLESFYLQDRPLTNADFDLFLAETGRPAQASDADYGLGIPDRPARLAWHEAEAYCGWLGALSGLALRLPREAEWEYAARSRIHSPPWPTSDGTFRRGVTVPEQEWGERHPPVASLPPNPLGFHDMVEGLREWVADRLESDPETTRIAKGSSSDSDSFYETIPTRAVVSARSKDELGARLPNRERIVWDAPEQIHYSRTTVRCALSDPRPPSEAGFGVAPDLEAISLPDVVDEVSREAQ